MDKRNFLNKFLKKIKDNNSDLGNKLKNKMRKLKDKTNKKSSSGPKDLNDNVDLNVKGRLKIEKYDEDGNVIDEHKEENLVVNDAYRMLLMNLGDEDSMDLFYNPILKHSSYQDDMDYYDGPPKEGEHFEWKIGKNRNPIYRSRHYTYRRDDSNTSYETYFNADGVNDFPSSGGRSYSILNEIYRLPKKINTNIPNFIGLGTKAKRFINNNSTSLTHSPKWTYDLEDDYINGIASVSTNNEDTITFSSDADDPNADEVTIFYTGHPRGKTATLYVNDEEVTKISTYAPEKKYGDSETIDLTDYHPTEDGDFELKFVVDSPEASGLEGEGQFTFEGLEIEGYNKETTSLAEEVPMEESIVSVPDYYHTTNEPPYEFMIDLKGSDGIDTETVEIYVDGEELTKVEGIPTPEEPEFTVEENGRVVIGFEARNVAVKHETIGEFNTEYKRAEIKRPRKTKDRYYSVDKGNQNYPIYYFDDQKIVFEAYFDKGNPNYPIEVYEVGLFNLPLKQNVIDEDDTGKYFEERMFSITDVPEIRKGPRDAIKVIWEIQFVNT